MFDVTNVDMNGWNEYKPPRSVAWYEKHTTLSILLADGLQLQMAGAFMTEFPPWVMEFQKGSNFRAYSLSIDAGIIEAWSTWVIWEDDELIITTQYEPPIMCDMESCRHLPQRCHWDMLIQNLEELVT